MMPRTGRVSRDDNKEEKKKKKKEVGQKKKKRKKEEKHTVKLHDIVANRLPPFAARGLLLNRPHLVSLALVHKHDQCGRQTHADQNNAKRPKGPAKVRLVVKQLG